ncbi:GAF domain-containing protein [Lysobacter sp. TY2-98]|uniref:GAF domain-containing protein n=1 Tax=Lysobacter sp. TY2-98 TaxID=2290922 RepID=UPI0013B3EE58|nr:GAF domain-containing protein [Lysobacter sp. TY2-98]
MSERQRQRDLDTYRIVDSLPETAYDDVVRIAARICDAPVATMSLIDRDRQWFKSRVGIESTETSREVAFCDHAVREPQLLMEVPDAMHDPRFRDNPEVTGGIGIRFYAGMPLVTPNGTAVGTVCVIDRRPRELDEGQRDALAALARITMNLLESRRQLLEAEITAALQPPAPVDGAHHGASHYSVVIVELQGYSRVVSQRGHRIVEQTLQQCSQALERLLKPGEALNRVSGAPEFVLTLNGDVDAERLQAIERVANASATMLGTDAVAAAASSMSPKESPLTVFGRADEELTRRKTERIDVAAASVEPALMRH